ncbi:unnamed protein product [Brachionus calyciflorus]|uniref:G-protein coupled receptors family 1 profile domain-containing protein n=1 Tax=Brachionus calyciflorus TaxID=104777 RepID=A0A813SED1_9BILA|nr:unnamed protein product [Brachionus calyciflorus]
MNITDDYGYIAWASKTGATVVYYLNILVFGPGILLNIIQILLFQMKKFNRTTMGFYFTINSVINILIIGYLMIYDIPMSQNIVIQLNSDWNCRIYLFLLRIFYQCSSWLNVAVTADRFLFVLFFNKFKFQNNRKILLMILFGILIVIVMVNTPNLLFYIVEVKSNSTQTSSRYCTAHPTVLLIRDIFAISIRTIIPFILMFFMNIVLIMKVRESKMKFKQSRNMNQEIRFSLTVIATTMIFLITYTPNVIWIALTNNFLNDQSIKQRQTYNAFLFLFEITSSIGYFVNYGMNIFVHFAFNSVFRKEVLRLLAQYLGIWAVKIKPENTANSSNNYRSNKSTNPLREK